ncbi:DUF3275 family protein [Pectobacterium carotovorum subsp. carotovorum]|uniref:DUF3275 family protein n=1 Tax=Pectobacterium TaxID=122277 RepID=UPI00057F4992|nr:MULTISPECIES: DUF3275 family protein [Pectobacterium]KHT39640.1 hypothetical protein RD02_15555 [Pectobacterium brasiliense]MDC9818148.1 DUF3275 family protein [Pectobacterium polonicum]POE23047.1 hypothetical protein BV923_07330 [Pectobacterium odoriferum]WDF97187.1 DUF3275 family protein [Pectobacterium carotovorum subsp. carotovorum]
MATAAVQSAPPIIVSGQLAIRTISGRNGRFTVGRLTTHLGLFHVKDPELEQYPEGKYEGEFAIRYIYPKAYPVGDGMRFEIRANLDGMTLSGIDKLSKAEARAFATQDVDPLDEESGTQPVPTPTATSKSKARLAPVQATQDPLVDTTPFSVDAPSATVAASDNPDSDDAALFGILWPLGESVKLDATIDRRTLRLQVARLSQLSYVFDATAQQWNRQSESLAT